MNKKVILIIVGVIVLLGISALITLNNSGKVQPAEPSDELILYYGAACPHCLVVGEFMADYNIEEKIPLIKKEVSKNIDNADELGEKAQVCGLKTDRIGIPFLWNGPEAKCLVGDEDIINFFKNKIGQ